MAVMMPRVVLVRRSTDYEALLARHATHGQAQFFLETRGQDIGELEDAHHRFHAALDAVTQAIPGKWRRNLVQRDDLDRFLFEPEDIVVALGQDGLVANLSKYLSGQPVIGVNPLPDRYDGILVPHSPEAIGMLLDSAAAEKAELEERTMVEAVLDDRQRVLALNEVFLGHQSHQSARYRLRYQAAEERQSSSGIIVTTGTGATGWARSLQLSRQTDLPLPAPTEASLAFFVREAFPSRATGTGLTEGLVAPGEGLEVLSEMNEGGVIFGDGIEDDRVEFAWGRRVEVRISATRLNLVRS